MMKKILIPMLVSLLLISSFALAEDYPTYDAMILNVMTQSYESAPGAVSNEGRRVATAASCAVDALLSLGDLELDDLDFDADFYICAFGDYTIDCYMPLCSGGHRNIFYVWEDYIKDYGTLTTPYFLENEEHTYIAVDGGDVYDCIVQIVTILAEN